MSLTILLEDAHEYVPKFPTTRILPSACVSMDWASVVTYQSANAVPIVNEVSLVPSVFNLTILFEVTPE